MNSESDIRHLNAESLRQNLGWFRTLGIGLIILGVISLALPFVAGFAITTLVGTIFVVGGIMRIVHAFRSRQWKRSAAEFLVSLLYIASGIILFAYPFSGMVTLTLFLAAFFVLAGFFKCVQALRIRPASHWEWTLLSGIVTFFLGIVIFAGLPMTAFWAIGAIVGIDLLFSGLSMVMIGTSMRDALQEKRPFCIGNVCFEY